MQHDHLIIFLSKYKDVAGYGSIYIFPKCLSCDFSDHGAPILSFDRHPDQVHGVSSSDNIFQQVSMYFFLCFPLSIFPSFLPSKQSLSNLPALKMYHPTFSYLLFVLLPILSLLLHVLALPHLLILLYMESFTFFLGITPLEPVTSFPFDF